jgi:hypothetical protein
MAAEGMTFFSFYAYERFQWVRDQLKKEGVNIPLPTGN